MDYKTRIFNAIKRHQERQSKVQSGPKRKNNKPEKMLEFEVSQWLKKNDFAFNVVESKAVYSHSAGRYLKGQTDSGFADIVGLDKNGNFIAIELKAPGRLSTLREKQREYLNGIINKNGFAVVIDNVKSLEEYYGHWIKEKNQDYLRSLLPKEKRADDSPLFED